MISDILFLLRIKVIMWLGHIRGRTHTSSILLYITLPPALAAMRITQAWIIGLEGPEGRAARVAAAVH